MCQFVVTYAEIFGADEFNHIQHPVIWFYTHYINLHKDKVCPLLLAATEAFSKFCSAVSSPWILLLFVLRHMEFYLKYQILSNYV